MNKALSVFLPIFVAWGFLSAEERSKESFQEINANQISEFEIRSAGSREPAAIDNMILDDAAPVFPETHIFDKADLEREWNSQREEIYSNVGLTTTEIAWLNEIDDVTDSNINRVLQEGSAFDPKVEKAMIEETQKILSASLEQKEDYVGTERYQYLLQARGFWLEDYRVKTGRDVKVRW